MNSIPFYDDENDCGDQCFTENQDDLDYEYILEQETMNELYQSCIHPSLVQATWNLVPLIIASFVCNIAARIRHIPHYAFHCITALTGIFIVWNYAYECFYLLLLFIFLFYFFLHLPKEYRKGIKVFLPSLLLILYCQFINPKEWHKNRGVLMIAMMKATSIAVDKIDVENITNRYEYMGYMFCGATIMFGPWTSFEDYVNLYKKISWKFWWIFVSISYMVVALFCLCVSNCWAHWILSDSAARWMVAFRDAFEFRSSHYFICFAASSLMLLGGYPLSQSLITKPYEIEVPRSLVQVVISWNIPMHNWLKTYVFRPGRKQLGTFGGIIMTYLASSILHGLNFQFAAVLLSLGFYTYIEYQLRQLLASVFDACITSKQCSLHKCEHSRTPFNCYWIYFVNGAFSILAMFHLAYLGFLFDRSENQETGYTYSHTIEKWSQLGYASHWVAFATYFIYYLIR